MAKQKTLFECQACGYQSAKWIGKCPNCGAWESFLEVKEKDLELVSKSPIPKAKKAVSITDVEETAIDRTPSGDDEFDIVLGGGIVSGSLVLIGGSPGVRKSTLLLKIAGLLAKRGDKTLYAAGEESNQQIKMRASRLGALDQNLYILGEIEIEAILEEAKNSEYKLIIIDSIQTMYSSGLDSAPGSVSQVKEITFQLMRYAKEQNITVFIIGHITKEGSIAGPRVLEHMVDTVLYFDGDGSSDIRILRSFKNRFGSTSEIGIFEMTSEGLVAAKNISSKFFSRDSKNPGFAITVLMEGSRPLAVEVQALVSESPYPNPKRSTNGFDASRLTMILALLERKLGLTLSRYDVYINVVGGIKVTEPSIDLAIIAAIVSSFRNRPINPETIFIGEVSLTGDIREVSAIENRLKEAASQGFKKALVPKLPKNLKTNIKCFEVNEVVKLLDWM
ncbi:MAG TPA: DNA repair protein RadA [Campylobacterales bacterium]|nr:DNA repair protein RadA [Campylobacterales bacterium]